MLATLGTSPLCRIWRQNSGKARALKGDGFVQLAPRGAADYSGLLCDGRRLEIETKATHTDTCSCESCAGQRHWAAMIRRFGGVYLRVRSGAEALAAVEAEVAQAAEAPLDTEVAHARGE